MGLHFPSNQGGVAGPGECSVPVHDSIASFPQPQLGFRVQTVQQSIYPDVPKHVQYRPVSVHNKQITTHKYGKQFSQNNVKYPAEVFHGGAHIA